LIALSAAGTVSNADQTPFACVAVAETSISGVASAELRARRYLSVGVTPTGTSSIVTSIWSESPCAIEKFTVCGSALAITAPR